MKKAAKVRETMMIAVECRIGKRPFALFVAKIDTDIDLDYREKDSFNVDVRSTFVA